MSRLRVGGRYWSGVAILCSALIALSLFCFGLNGYADELGNSIPQGETDQYARVICGSCGMTMTDLELNTREKVMPGRHVFVCGGEGKPKIHVFDVEAGYQYLIRPSSISDFSRYSFVNVKKLSDDKHDPCSGTTTMNEEGYEKNCKTFPRPGCRNKADLRDEIDRIVKTGSVFRFRPWGHDGYSISDGIQHSYLDGTRKAVLAEEKRKIEELERKAEQQKLLAEQAARGALLERQKQLRSGAIKTENMRDVALRYEGSGKLVARMATPLLKPDGGIYEGVVTLDAEESAGVLLAKNDPSNDPLLGYVMAENNPFVNAMISTTGRDVLSFVKLKITKQSVDFSKRSMSIGGRVQVFGKYVANQKLRGGKLLPVLEVLYIEGN